jgi:two-component system chemotaxis sensor kinase CheA
MADLDALLAGLFEAQVRLGGLRPALAELEQGRPSPALRRLATGVDQLDRELRQVRETAERMRLTPASGLFTFLARAVRDAAVSIETPIAFAPSGGDVRVDAVVFNIVQGALLHVVRNAVTHGIEPSLAARAAAGKPAEGVVALAVRQHGRLATFTCTDDGRGIDLDAVRDQLARRAGTAGTAIPADADGLLQALLRGGISTSSAVTDLAGRGIGLDAVREAADRLGGHVTLRTHAGHGTTVELTVPLSVASLPALVVEVAGRRVAIPLDAVAQTLRVGRDAIVRAEQHDTVLVDGRAIPLAPLARLTVGAGASGPASPQVSAVIVRGRGGDAAAFAVDRVVAVGPVLLRPLPAYAPARRVIAGAALDAVGEPLLILDPEPLVDDARQASRTPEAAAPVPPPILVVDDSLTTRMLEQSILESAGYDVDTATSAEEALEKARTSRYALFLVDVEMPGLDGFGFVERIRADSELAQVPAILVTSRSAPEDRQRGLAVGAQAYIVKSEFDQGVLLDRIRVLVG